MLFQLLEKRKGGKGRYDSASNNKFWNGAYTLLISSCWRTLEICGFSASAFLKMQGGPILIPGFCIRKSLQPLLPVFLQVSFDATQGYTLEESTIICLFDVFFQNIVNLYGSWAVFARISTALSGTSRIWIRASIAISISVPFEVPKFQAPIWRVILHDSLVYWTLHTTSTLLVFAYLLEHVASIEYPKLSNLEDS